MQAQTGLLFSGTDITRGWPGGDARQEPGSAGTAAPRGEMLDVAQHPLKALVLLCGWLDHAQAVRQAQKVGGRSVGELLWSTSFPLGSSCWPGSLQSWWLAS